jgi:NAD+ kinase
MDIMWCGKDYCKDAVRERVVGDHNQILLNGPATGQVAYYWNNHENAGSNSARDSSSSSSSSLKKANAVPETAAPSVLLLVKPGDPELLEIAAAAVTQLTEGHPKVDILLDPSTAAKLKHYHGVESEQIHLFEATPTPGFGDNLRPDDVLDRLDPWNVSDPDLPQLKQSPDLICTLGGDGLLMHAGMMFQGPVPPILCVSGGSLGFLTPFQNHEMVEAVRLALGLVQSQADNDVEVTDFFTDIDVFPPNMPTYPYEPLPRTVQQKPDTKKTPRFAFGLGGRICLSIRMRLECRVLNREGTVRARYNVLNEVVIDRGSSPYLAALECFCDDVHLTTVQADGVIFATPTGSTAYSMAAGGSVVHPAVPCILVTPICPHVLSFRSMVFPDHVVLDVYVPDDARSEASVSFDGKFRQDLRRGDCVEISMSPYAVPTVNRFDHSTDWLGSLKRNFNFNSRPRQKPLSTDP